MDHVMFHQSVDALLGAFAQGDNQSPNIGGYLVALLLLDFRTVCAYRDVDQVFERFVRVL